MNKLARISATVASSLALVAGFSGIAGAATISDSGRNSDNDVSYQNVVKTDVDNNTNLHLNNSNDQEATSGDANVKHNDDVSDVSTGSAWNDNSTDASVAVMNTTNTGGGSGSGGGMASDWSAPDATISDSGRNSDNSISFKNEVKTNVDNNTNVCLTNTNEQTATSGTANVKGNDDVGNVSTGDASNTNSSSFSLSVSNTTN